jgi:hypothetical protein
MGNHLTSHITWTTCLFCKLVTSYKLFLLLPLLSSPSYGSLSISRLPMNCSSPSHCYHKKQCSIFSWFVIQAYAITIRHFPTCDAHWRSFRRHTPSRAHAQREEGERASRRYAQTESYKRGFEERLWKSRTSSWIQQEITVEW